VRLRLSGAAWLSQLQRRLLIQGVKAALGPKAKLKGELCIIFVDNPGICRLHKRFLGKNRATDVIAFHYPSPKYRTRREEMPFGDIYICQEVAKRQAKELGHSLFEELLTLAVHGALHLVGYDDYKPKDKRLMFKRQEHIVRRFLALRNA
jgi:probable rRNA maturation factor